MCPWFLAQIAAPPTSYSLTPELVKKAADVKAKSLLGKLNAKYDGDFASPVDSLGGFEHVLLHEVCRLRYMPDRC